MKAELSTLPKAAPREVSTAQAHVFEHVALPLVLGGHLEVGRPLGSKRIGAFEKAFRSPDQDRWGKFQLARQHVLRTLVPLDTIPEPSEREWVLLGALHDLCYASYPGLSSVFRSSRAPRILRVVQTIIDGAGYPTTVREAIETHTLFARVLEIGRPDTTVRWWTGSRIFRGTQPPQRLLAMPELRGVRVDRVQTKIDEIAEGSIRDPFFRALSGLVRASPITNLATFARTWPSFEWDPWLVGLFGVSEGRRIALRAVAASSTTSLFQILLPSAARVSESHKNHVLALLGERLVQEFLETEKIPSELRPLSRELSLSVRVAYPEVSNASPFGRKLELLLRSIEEHGPK